MSEGTISIPQWTLGDRLRKARTDRNVSPQEMAKLLNRSVRSIYGYEADSIPVRVDVINQYALRLQVPVSWFVTGRDPGPIPPNTPASECLQGHPWSVRFEPFAVTGAAA